MSYIYLIYSAFNQLGNIISLYMFYFWESSVFCL